MMYEDYFRNIVGGSYNSPEYYMANYNLYPTYMNDYGEEYAQYENDMYNMNNDYNRFMPRQVNGIPYYNDYQDNQKYMEVSSMYPEIYKKIEPILERTLANVDLTNLDKNKLDKITFEIYDKVEKEVSNNDISSATSKAVNQSNTFGVARTVVPTSVGMNNKDLPNKQTSVNNKETKEVVTPPRRSNNLLSDLIRILILNKIIGNRRPPFPAPRPPFRPLPNPRPPFPGPRPHFQRNAPISYFDAPYPEEQNN